MAKLLQPPFSYYGGKTLLAQWVISNFPEHDNYCEPFGGSGAVLLGKKPVKLETYNDLNSGVVNFYRCLRDKNKLAELTRLCELTLHSREEFNHCRELIQKQPVEYADLQHAWAWYSCAWQSFGGDIGKGGNPSWGLINKNQEKISDTHIIAENSKKIIDFKIIHERLQYVQIENMDALKLMERLDAPDLLIYADPPYEQSTGDSKYLHGINDSDFIDFILKLKAMVVISGFDCEIYQKLDNAGWSRRVKTRVISAGKLETRNRKTECLWINPLAQKNTPQKDLF